MTPQSVHRGEMSQDSPAPVVHHTDVAGRIVDPASKRTRGLFQTLSLSSVGLEFGIAVVIGLLFGRWLDDKAGTDPWLMFLFLGFGFAAGLRGILRALKRADAADAREKERNDRG